MKTHLNREDIIMFSKIKNMIEYSGLDDELPVLDNPSCFKQFCFSENLSLSEAKPDVLQITRVVSEIEVKDNIVVRTPKAISLEGQKLTGFKLMVEGNLKLKVEYVSDTPTQIIYAENFDIPFTSFIILPESFKSSTGVMVTGYIEDISADIFSNRNIFINAILLMVADF
jgi:hypothetical protein